MDGLNIRRIREDEWDLAMELAFRVFLKFEAETYGREGTEAFAKFVTDEMLKRAFLGGHYHVFAAVEEETIIGMVALRSGNHISLLFVDQHHHNRGIGTALLEYAADFLKDNTGYDRMTVNSSPYAVQFYRNRGFYDTGEETVKDGIIYTPMQKDIEDDVF